MQFNESQKTRKPNVLFSPPALMKADPPSGLETVYLRDLPSSPLAKTLCFQCREHKFDL